MTSSPSEPLTIDRINEADREQFVSWFADIAERSRWVAERAYELGPFEDREALVRAFETVLLHAEPNRQLTVLIAHPDLAGRLARRGQVGEASRQEQASAGLDALTDEEFARFDSLNRAYRRRFGFPFILAVKGATKADILASFETRVPRPLAAERETALNQVCRIMRVRLEDRIADGVPADPFNPHA